MSSLPEPLSERRELLEDLPGALWQRDWIDRDRVERAPDLKRIVVAIDPAVSNTPGSDETGIIAQEIVATRLHKSVMVCTAYDPDSHTVKGVLQPSGVESGWMPIGTPSAGSNHGILVGPKVGSADALDGTMFDVHFDGSNGDAAVAGNRHFSSQDQPPRVEESEMLIQHESGARVFFDKEGQVTISRTDGAKVMLKKNGDSVAAPKPGAIHYSGGDPDEGDTFDWIMTPSGPSNSAKAKVG